MVVWEDAWSDDKRVPDAEGYYEQTVLVEESGWLKTNNKERVVICRQFSDHVVHEDNERMFSSCISIPKSLIRKMKVIDLDEKPDA